jgi:hypothetical protein
MEEFRKPKENQRDEAIASKARIAGLQSFCLTITIFAFRVRDGFHPVSKGHGYGNCFITGAERFSAENGALFDILVIRDFRIGIYAWFASPRVRQR